MPKVRFSIGWISENVRPGVSQPHIVKLPKKVTTHNGKLNACIGHDDFSQEVYDAKNGVGK